MRGRNRVVVFIDFKKSYDLIDQQTLFNVMEEFRVEGKTRAITKQTLTKTVCKVKFHRENSAPVEIKTGRRTVTDFV